MTVWRESRALALTAFAAGAGAGWAVSGQYAVLRGLLLLGASLGVLNALGRSRGAAWVWGALPTLVAAGWLGGVLVWDWALGVAILLFGVPLWAAVGLGPRGVSVGVGGSYAVLTGAIVLGLVPRWCALGVLTAPLALRAAQLPFEMGPPAWREWLLALNGQVLLGFLIEEMVR